MMNEEVLLEGSSGEKRPELKCPECGNSKILTDYDSGEIVCGGCGIVLGDVEYAPPPERTPKIEPTRVELGTLNPKITCIHVTSSKERSNRQLLDEIDRIRQKLNLPATVVEEARRYAEQISKALRNEKTRLTCLEKAALSTWIALRNRGRVMSVSEYEATVASVCQGYRPGTLFKLQKTLVFAGLPAELNGKPATHIDFISKIATKLEEEGENCEYLHVVAGLAVKLVDENKEVVRNKDPILSAAAAFHAADHMLARKFSAEKIAGIVGVGVANVKARSSVLENLYKKPLTPKELRSALM